MPKLATEGNLFATEDNTLICLDNSHTCRLTGIEKELCKKNQHDLALISRAEPKS